MSQKSPCDFHKPWPRKDILNSLPPAFQCLGLQGSHRMAIPCSHSKPTPTLYQELWWSRTHGLPSAFKALAVQWLVEQPHARVPVWPQLSLGARRAKYDPMPIQTQAQRSRGRNLAIQTTRRSAIHRVCAEARETLPRRSPHKPGQEDGHYQLTRNPSLRSHRQLPARQEEDAFHLLFPYLRCLPRLCLGQLNLHLSSHSLRLL